MRWFYSVLRRHLLLGRREANGLFVFFLLFVGWLASFHLWDFFWQMQSGRIPAPVLDSLSSNFFQTDTTSLYHKSVQNHQHQQEVVRFYFDPNTASLSDWQKLGVPDRLARRILNYRNKGGRFKNPTDLKKIYNFPDSLYQQLAPYIQITNKPISTQDLVDRRARLNHSHELLSIELNRADSNQLKRLPGIGSTYARRIIRYREKLGGFASVEQIREVYGITDSLFQNIYPYLKVDTTEFSLRKIPINHCDAAILAAHPYLSASKARAIIAYRQQHGPFRQLNNLLNIQVLTAEDVQKLAPYLLFD